MAYLGKRILRRQPDAKGYGSWGAKRIRSIRARSMCLLQQHLEPRFVAPNIARWTIRRQRFGARAKGLALQWMYVGLLLAAEWRRRRPGVSCWELPGLETGV